MSEEMQPPEGPDHSIPESASGDASPPAVGRISDETMVSTLLATFERKPDEPVTLTQDRFIDEIIIPALERGPLVEARGVVGEIAEVLEQGVPSPQIARDWYVLTSGLVRRTSRMLEAIHDATGEYCGVTGAFAMAEIAHHCPKFLHHLVASSCLSMALALERGDRKAAEIDREAILTELQMAKPMDEGQRFEALLAKYSISHGGFREKFSKAEQGLCAMGNFTRIQGTVGQRFANFVRDVLRVEQQKFSIVFTTNAPHDEQDVFPYEGMICEVLGELIHNALKVMELSGRGDTIQVNILLQGDGSLLLRVRDNGPGYAGQDPEEMFAPRMTTTQALSGTGMGLSYLRADLQSYFGGSISAIRNVEEDEEPGMTFVVRIPPQPEK